MTWVQKLGVHDCIWVNKMFYRVCSVYYQHEYTLQLGTPPTDILWQATTKTGVPHLHFLAPPTELCYRYHSPLYANNPPTSIVLYLQDGPIPVSKIILQCTRCNLNYHPDMYGNDTEGYRYYDAIQPVVKCTQQARQGQLCVLIASAGYIYLTLLLVKAHICAYICIYKRGVLLHSITLLVITTDFLYHATCKYSC